MQLARTTQLPQVANWLNKETQRDSREQFLKRFLLSPYFNQEAAYHPLVKAALSSYKAPQWHLILDRTNLDKHRLDLLMISLAFRKRAIPLGWQVRPFGGTGSRSQIQFLERIMPLIPAQQQVIVHGDTEFCSVPMMRYIRPHPGWDFILAQKKKTYFQTSDGAWVYLADLVIKPRHPIYRANLTWTKHHQYQSVNLFAFYSPHQSSPTGTKYKVRYCATSLPIAHTLRRVGRRRWGIECMFRDYKSSGWHIDQSGLQQPAQTETLLVLLSINYLWATVLGRWLCKSGRRAEVDTKKSVISLIFALALIGSFINTTSVVLSRLTLIFTINPFLPLLFSHITERR
ncbi:MAG: transposase [Anaerolineae bacterium]|nr:transposase [Anaerolineae bacterium]